MRIDIYNIDTFYFLIFVFYYYVCQINDFCVKEFYCVSHVLQKYVCIFLHDL